ncbi:toll/interleukin-1 receptor domain-containing protein [Thermococcus sp.]
MEKDFEIFLSYYTRTGLDYAEELKKVLRDNGWKAFLAHHNILAGEHWKDIIFNYVLPCIKYFVLLYTPGAEKRKWIRQEYKYAKRLRKTIIACVYIPVGESVGNILTRIEPAFPGISEKQVIEWRDKSELNSKVILTLERYQKRSPITGQLSRTHIMQSRDSSRDSHAYQDQNLTSLVEMAILEANSNKKIELIKTLQNLRLYTTTHRTKMEALIDYLKIYIKEDLPISLEFIKELELVLHEIVLERESSIQKRFGVKE